jgi:predicted dehydrogenase
MQRVLRPYRVAILGCGPRGTASGTAYAAHPRTSVVGLCDLAPERLNALGDALGVAWRFSDHETMIRETRPDIAVIATPADLHFDLAMQVLDRGVNVDVEKPLCLDLEQADAVVARGAARGVQVAVHHQYRSGSAMRALLRLVEDGRVGQIHHIEANCKGYYGGFGLMNLGTHLINAFLTLAGHCRSVVASATTAGRPITPEDVVPSPVGMGTIAGERITATLEFESGVSATLLHHRLPRVESSGFGVKVYGTEGRLWSRSGGAWWLPTPHDCPEDGPWQPLPLELPPGYDSSRIGEADEWVYVDEFVRALDEGRDPQCSGNEARHALEVMMGIFESAAYGIRVELPQARRDHPLLRWRREAGFGPPAAAPREYSAWLSVEDARSGRGSGAE